MAGRKVVPELLQFQATPAGIAGEALSLLRDNTRREKMKDDLKEVAEALGSPGASDRAARAILRTIGLQTHKLMGQACLTPTSGKTNNPVGDGHARPANKFRS